jgi:SAM-dependent methyltransferase
MGQAIADCFYHRDTATLRVLSPDFDEDEMPLDTLFRGFREMPSLEQRALREARGNILDVGAGTGCHALALQEMNKTVTAIDISSLSVEVMRERGVERALAVDLFDESFAESFDTILMLMNGSGIIGRLSEMPRFFARMKRLLRPDGSILMDSSDLRYLFEEEDGSYMIDLADEYYGETTFQMVYRDCCGSEFPWLYVDFQTLSLYAEANGFRAQLLEEGDHYDYLAQLTPIC